MKRSVEYFVWFLSQCYSSSVWMFGCSQRVHSTGALKFPWSNPIDTYCGMFYQIIPFSASFSLSLRHVISLWLWTKILFSVQCWWFMWTIWCVLQAYTLFNPWLHVCRLLHLLPSYCSRSSKVQPFAGIAEVALPGVPRLLFNKQASGPFLNSPRANDVVAEGRFIIVRVWCVFE